MAWEPDRRSNFFFSPPAHLCAVTYMTEISLIVTLNNQFTSPSQLKASKRGLGISRKQLLVRTGVLCQRMGIPSFKNKTPSKDCLNGVRKRHPKLTLQKPEKLGASGARMTNPVVENMQLLCVLGQCSRRTFPREGPGVMSRMCPPYPQRDRKRRLNGTVCRNHRTKRVVPCRC